MIREIYQKLVPEQTRIAIREQLWKWTSWRYRGNRVVCNCCHRSFSRFLPKGKWKNREDAVCPYCGSLERTRALLFYLELETTIFTKPTNLLHFAPETCLKKILSKTETIDYTDADINPALASAAFNIEAIPYEDDAFEYIICSHVLAHVEDEQQAVKELYRILKPGGAAFIMTLIDGQRDETLEDESITSPDDRLKHYSEPDMLRLHGKDFPKRLEAGGFNVEIINYAEKLGRGLCEKYKLGNGDRELIFKCTK